jgi:two-component system, sensor histidine kinase and response regulator
LAQSDIMIVDDNPANLRLLEDMLRQKGHEVHSFPRGRLALAEALENPPDLILLDINMPEMNGYEVCERLKSTDDLRDIPVIFLSALNDIQDKVKAFRSGAVDYISKPFQIEEVHARVETHIKLHDLQRALTRQNEHLEEAVAARTRELAEANQRLTILDRSKSDFLNLISHEFRTPLNGILGVGELIFDAIPANEETNELQELFKRSRRRILSILEDALLLTQIDVKSENFRSAPVSFSTALRRAMERADEFAESREVTVIAPPADMGMVLADENLLVRALQALLETAIKFSEKGQVVELSSDAAADSRRIIIESQGRTIQDAALAKFFDLFSINEALTPGGDLGVGPPLAYRILSLFRGSVSVANRNPAGIRLTISLRKAVPADGAPG